MNVILLSGGSGKRLWPLSNDVRSKQFLKILQKEDGSSESMVQRTYRMIKEFNKDVRVTFATSESQINSIRTQLGEEVDINVEPCRRDTFPAIALAVSYLHDIKKLKDEEPIIVCPVDPYTEEGYFSSLNYLSNISESGSAKIALLGIEPTYPSSKYGYIMMESDTSSKNIELKYGAEWVSSFKEKPTEELASQYIEHGALWNAGIFAFKIGYLLDKSKELLGASEYQVLYDNYEDFPPISFDHAVVEKESSICVLRYKGEWKDLGTWNTLTEAMSENVSGNAVEAECENTHVINELQIPLVALGCKDLAIAATPDGILVTDKDASFNLKEYVGDSRPMFEERPWGEYQVLDHRNGTGGNSLTKHLFIKAGKHLSYQLHNSRSEAWTVIDGEGIVILDGKPEHVSIGMTVNINSGVKHAVKALSELHIIEVQIGLDLVEEDIERFDFNWDSI